jgi:hypothetical protein
LDVVDAAAAALDAALAPGSVVVDYAPNLETHPAFAKRAAVNVPVSWCLDSGVDLHVYAKRADEDIVDPDDEIRSPSKAALPSPSKFAVERALPPTPPPRPTATPSSLPSPSAFAVERPLDQ